MEVQASTQSVETADQQRLDVVLPLLPRDLDRAERLLLPTLFTYFAPIKTCRVIVPDSEIPHFAARLTDSRFEIIGENDLVPELRWFQRTGEAGAGETRGLRNWFVQQLLKLSAARIVGTPFYVTFDADVLCCRPIGYGDLVIDGRAVAVVSPNGDRSHERWYERSAAVLGMPRSDRTHGVTPAVLSKAAVLELLGFFEERLKPNLLRPEALLLTNVPWTEYSLYYTYLERVGQFDHYHHATLNRTYRNNIWGGGNPAAWDPALSFGENGPLFTVLQGHTVPDFEAIVTKIRAYFQTVGTPSPV